MAGDVNFSVLNRNKGRISCWNLGSKYRTFLKRARRFLFLFSLCSCKWDLGWLFHGGLCSRIGPLSVNLGCREFGLIVSGVGNRVRCNVN